jgi:hypothetical protein
MFIALDAVSTVTKAITLPLALTVSLAIVALVALAIVARRARRAGTFSGVNALATGVSAAGILLSALVVSIAFGGATIASAAVPATPSTSVSSSLTGHDFPTK